MGLVFWQCRSWWSVAHGHPHFDILRGGIAQCMLYTPLWRPMALVMAAPCIAMHHEYAVGKSLIVLGPHWLAKGGVLGVYSSGHHIHHPSSPDTHTPPPPPPPCSIRHSPHTPTNAHHIPNHHPPQSPTTTPPNPRPPFHPIPDHHPSTFP